VYLNGLKFVLSKAKTLERQPVPKVLKESILTSVTLTPTGSIVQNTRQSRISVLH